MIDWMAHAVRVVICAAKALVGLVRAVMHMEQAIQEIEEWLAGQRRSARCLYCGAELSVVGTGMPEGPDGRCPVCWESWRRRN